MERAASGEGVLAEPNSTLAGMTLVTFLAGLGLVAAGLAASASANSRAAVALSSASWAANTTGSAKSEARAASAGRIRICPPIRDVRIGRSLARGPLSGQGDRRPHRARRPPRQPPT